ncbi:hypothetical protein RND71_042858 [Anisodus tanguticus]|uniref:Uncharacterized protein n=1 Tax=Anisodus tanguticus TaxID=243964 RepID=A0AAE1QS85_9SOLA|nr:hypothetical protein RND71_042858 [Anisodus tanguticus]
MQCGGEFKIQLEVCSVCSNPGGRNLLFSGVGPSRCVISHPSGLAPTILIIVTIGSNLPSLKKVAQLLHSTIIDKVKIYDTNPEILEAFSNTSIDLIVAVENSHVANLSATQSVGDEWFSIRILPFIPSTSIVAIVVGNELHRASNGSDGKLSGEQEHLQLPHQMMTPQGNDFEFLPFSAGRRICPGLSMHEKFGVTLQKKEPLLLIPKAKIWPLGIRYKYFLSRCNLVCGDKKQVIV